MKNLMQKSKLIICNIIIILMLLSCNINISSERQNESLPVGNFQNITVVPRGKVNRSKIVC